jgi:BclB C-terminal domain-containing protein
MGTDDGDAGGTADNGVLEAGEIDDTESLCDGPTGTDGAAGPGGPAGVTGSIGAAGPTGATGAAGDASTLGFDGLVAYASGSPIEVSTVDGAPDDVAMPGFGTWAQLVNIDDLGALDLTGSPGRAVNAAFVVPFDGTVTRISGFFSTTVSLALGASTLEYGVALYVATGSDNTFEVVTDSVAGFSALTGTVDAGTTDSFEFSPLTPIPIAAGMRLLMVIAASSTDPTLDATLEGYFSGGLQLEEPTSP